MSGKRSVETTAAQVTAELLQPGFGPGKRVTIIFKPALSPARLGDRARENPTVLPPYKISALVRPLLVSARRSKTAVGRMARSG